MATSTIHALVSVAHEAGAAIQRERDNGLSVASKTTGEIVTSADRASHEIVARRLRDDFPGVPLVSEEGDSRDIGCHPKLVVDELDGTGAFAAGSKHWGVMIALVDGTPTHGVTYLPDLGVTISAVEDKAVR